MRKAIEMLKTWLFALLVAFLVAGAVFYTTESFGQGKTFPVGKVVVVRAVMCFSQDAAKVLARLKGQEHELTARLIHNGWCVLVNGYGKYEKKVYSEDSWSVWSVRFGDSFMFEATDWHGTGDI